MLSAASSSSRLQSPVVAVTSTSPQPPEALPVLFKLIDSLMRLHSHDDVPVSFLLAELEHYAKHRQVYFDWQRFAIFSPAHYTRNLVQSSEVIEIIILCWAPGQEARIHDHGQSHCFMIALEGEVIEKRYAKAIVHYSGGGSAAMELTNEEASPTDVPSTCPRLQQTSETRLTAGGCGTHISNKEAVHSVGNYSNRQAVTLHVYAPPISRVKVFDPEGNQVTARMPGFFSVHGRMTGKD